MSHHQTRDQRREAAQARNDAWAALHYTQQLDRLHRRPGFSQRQRDRIMDPITSKIKRRALARRFGQCDETCTVDCGHCKGQRFAAFPTNRTGVDRK